MSLIVYAIGEPAEVTGAGLFDAALWTVCESGLMAVVSESDASRLEAEGANLVDYEQVVERLMAEQTILPMRFGTMLPGRHEVTALLADRHDALHAGLNRVRGAVELSVRAGWRSAPNPTTSAARGTAYMLDRVAVHRRAQELADRLDPLAALAREMRHRLLTRGDLPVRGAYLVDRELVTQFAARVKQLDERHEDIDLVCTGPWPPYSFTPERPHD